MEYNEHELPQRQQLPAAFRRSVGNDVVARSRCPINGTTFDGQAKPIPEKNRLNYHNRKERERKRSANGNRSKVGDRDWQARQYGKMRALGKMRPSFSDSATMPIVPAVPAPRGTCHMWSIEDPSSPSTPVDYQGSTTQPQTNFNHLNSPTPPLGQYAQLLTGTPDDGAEIHLYYPYTGVGAASSCSSTLSSAASTLSTTHDAPTTSDLKTFHDEPLTRASSSPPPAVSVDDFAMRAISSQAHATPSGSSRASPDTEGSWWCNDRFFEVYQGFFIPRAPNSRDSTSSVPFEHHHETVEPTNGSPAPQPQAFPTAPMSHDNTVHHDTAEQYPLQGSRFSHSEYATQFEGNDHIGWSIPLMLSEAIYHQRLAELGAAAMAGYPDTLRLQASLLPSPVPEEAYIAMHRSPLVIQTSSMTLTGALESPHRSLIDHSAPSTPAAARCRGPSRRDAAWAEACPQNWHAAPASSL